MSRLIFVTGGVVSSLGKGITAASLGTVLAAVGLLGADTERPRCYPTRPRPSRPAIRCSGYFRSEPFERFLA